MNNKAFWKMKQTDRIEYFLYREYIIEITRSSFFSSVWSFMALMFAFLTIGFLFYIAFDSLDLLLASLKFFKIIIWAIIFILCLDLWNVYRRNKKIKQLNKKFKIQPSPTLKERLRNLLE